MSELVEKVARAHCWASRSARNRPMDCCPYLACREAGKCSLSFSGDEIEGARAAIAAVFDALEPISSDMIYAATGRPQPDDEMYSGIFRAMLAQAKRDLLP